MTVKVRQLNDANSIAWDTFVASHPEGTFCHKAGWKRVVEQGARHHCPFLIAEQDGAVVGVMPLTIRKSVLFGTLAVSSMFGVYGGPLAYDTGSYEALEEEAWRLALDAGAEVLEYRTKKARHDGDADWYVERNKSATFIREIVGKAEQDILLEIPRKQRAVVRKSLKNNLISDWNGSIKEFYFLYARSVRGLGTPVFPRRLFEAFVDVFGSDVSIQIVREATGNPVAGLMSFYTTDTVLPYYAGTGAGARELGAHDFMYFELMQRAVATGRKYFDFGRSKVGSGPYKFKKNWGFEPTLLEYQYRRAEGATIPDISPQNKKYQMMIAVWKRMPLPIANFLGPPISRHLG